MGVTTTPINALSLPDDNEALRNVYAHVRNHAQQLEAALRSHGLTSTDVTGYLDLVGVVNALGTRVTTLEGDTAWTFPTLNSGYANLDALNPGSWTRLRYRKLNAQLIRIVGTLAGPLAAGTIFTLPTGYRPLYKEAITGTSAPTAAAQVEVQSSGAVVLTAAVSGYLTFNGTVDLT